MIRHKREIRDIYEVEVEERENAALIGSLVSQVPAGARLVDVDDCNGTFTLTFEKEISE